MVPRELHERKKPAAGMNVPAEGCAVALVTVCTKDRSAWLACEDVHAILADTWKHAVAWRTGKYVLMPDHLHLFAAFAGSDISLDAWVKYWKSIFSKRHGVPEHAWQSRSFHHRLRSGDSYAAKWEYVRNNPVRHGLVKTPEEWRFQGEIFGISWDG
jgi:putative transposase